MLLGGKVSTVCHTSILYAIPVLPSIPVFCNKKKIRVAPINYGLFCIFTDKLVGWNQYKIFFQTVHDNFLCVAVHIAILTVIPTLIKSNQSWAADKAWKDWFDDMAIYCNTAMYVCIRGMARCYDWQCHAWRLFLDSVWLWWNCQHMSPSTTSTRVHASCCGIETNNTLIVKPSLSNKSMEIHSIFVSLLVCFFRTTQRPPLSYWLQIGPHVPNCFRGLSNKHWRVV